MPTIHLQDRAPLTRTRKLADGRLAAVARFARSGVYSYSGAEVGRPDLSTVNVYRSEDEVFAEDSMASFAHKAMTLDHPGEAVDSRNWKRVAVGYTEGRVARDGGFVEIPLMLADAEAVRAYETGQATELSAAYSCELIWGDGVAPDGTPYAAKQTRIRGDSIALVPKGRAGAECRIGDAMLDKKPKPPVSIDEALRQAFATMAKNKGRTVRELLAEMDQLDIEKTAANVAKQFVSAQAGAGVASMYGDSAVGLAKSAANAMKREALGGGPGARVVRDLALSGRYAGAPPLSAPSAAGVSNAAEVRDAARSMRYL